MNVLAFYLEASPEYIAGLVIANLVNEYSGPLCISDVTY